jgi:predicted ATPase
LLTEVKAALANTRLLTLVGPGGVGKPASPYVPPRISGGPCTTALGSSTSAVSLIVVIVPKAVIAALGLADKSGQWPTSLLVAHLASREALLVLDNCEHLLDAVAWS